MAIIVCYSLTKKQLIMESGEMISFLLKMHLSSRNLFKTRVNPGIAILIFKSGDQYNEKQKKQREDLEKQKDKLQDKSKNLEKDVNAET